MSFRAAILAIGAVCWVLGCGAAAPAKAEPHASIVAAARAGVDLCSEFFLRGGGRRFADAASVEPLYESAAWRSAAPIPNEFGTRDIGGIFGEAVLAPGISGRVVSALGQSVTGGGSRCDLIMLDAPGARAQLLSQLDASDEWTSLRIPNVPLTKMYGRPTSRSADFGLTIMWTHDQGPEPNKTYLQVSLIPKASLATGVFPPDEE